MCHYKEEDSFLDRVRLFDRSLTERIAQWQEELTAEQYRERIRDLVDDLDECQNWVGREGDDAVRLHTIVAKEFESL